MLLLLASLAHAVPVLVERFNTVPEGWKERVVQPKGGGPTSKVEFPGGVVKFTADARTRKFTAWGKRIDLKGVEWLVVDAKETVSGVENAPANAICGAFVRFDTGQIVPTRACAARTDTSTHRRYIQVPKGARDAEVGVLLDTAGTVTVDDLLVDTTAPDVKSTVRGSFVYHWVGNDAYRDADYEANETRFDQLSAFLGLKPGAPVEYWKYPDATALEAYTGQVAPYVATPNVAHSILRSDTRALLGALSTAWGAPPPLLFEGLAVHLQGDWDDREPRLSTRMQVNEGTAPSLATLLDPKKFAAEPPERAFTQAGAFIGWIVATKGPETVKALFGATSITATPAANQAAIEKVLGAPLTKIESDFRASL